MGELIGRLASNAGIDSAVAGKNIGIVHSFPRHTPRSGRVQALVERSRGADRLSVGEIQNVTRELFNFGRDKIGPDQMDEIISGDDGPNRLA